MQLNDMLKEELPLFISGVDNILNPMEDAFGHFQSRISSDYVKGLDEIEKYFGNAGGDYVQEMSFGLEKIKELAICKETVKQ